MPFAPFSGGLRSLLLGAVPLFFFPGSLFSINFNAPRTYPAASNLTAHGLAVGDLNGDGVSDIAAGLDGYIQIFLGRRDGGLTPGVVYEVPYLSSSSSSIAIADFNNDGIPDLAAVTASAIAIFLGNGDGTFRTPVSIAQPTGLFSIACADFNGDGNPDLAVVNSTSNNVLVLLGDGDGSFEPAASYSVGLEPAYLAVADFNRDGKLDLAVTNYGQSGISILYGAGDGTFLRPVTHGTGRHPQSIAAGDFNGDGRPDVAVTLFEGGVQILLAGPDGTFSAPMDFLAGPNPASIQVFRSDPDGLLDLAVVNETGDLSHGGGNTVSILKGAGDGTFGGLQSYFIASATVLNSAQSVAFGDFNGDHKVDIAAASTGVSILLGNGQNQFQQPQTLPAGSGPAGIVAADFDGDGKPDLAVANSGSGTVSIFINKGDGSFMPQVMYDAGGSDPVYLAAGDFNRDGKMDLAVGVHKGVTIMLGNGDGTFQAGYFAVLSAAATLTTADLNLDGILDLVGGSYVALGKGDGTFGRPLYVNDIDLVFCSVVGDFNGDDIPDVALSVWTDAGYYSSYVTVSYLGLGTGNFTLAGYTGALANLLVAADFNGDGKNDLLAGWWLAFGNGDGTFAFPYYLPYSPYSNLLGVADFDQDGKLDMAIGGMGIAVGNGDGTFQPASYFVTAGTAAFAAIADFNGDGKPDVAVTGTNATEVTVLLNTTGNREH